MSDYTPASRPEPVLDAQQLTRAVLALLGAASALLAVFGVTLDIDDTITQTIGAVVGAGVLIAGLVLPRLRALKAREVVTPLSDPRTADGRRLIPQRTGTILPVDPPGSSTPDSPTTPEHPAAE